MRPRGGRARRLRMTELSTHGAWLRTSKPLEEGTLVDVVISVSYTHLTLPTIYSV